jgi:hypothetical protein
MMIIISQKMIIISTKLTSWSSMIPFKNLAIAYLINNFLNICGTGFQEPLVGSA